VAKGPSHRVGLFKVRPASRLRRCGNGPGRGMGKGLPNKISPARRTKSRRPRTSPWAAWESLSEEIRRCQLCPLGRTRTHAVVYRGSLTPRIVFVGEAPGAEEDRTGIPFVGRSGARLNAAVERLGLTASDFGVLNVLKCRPPGNRFDRAAARTCRPYLDRQLALLLPDIVVPLGASALRAFDPKAPPMLEAAGHPRGTSSVSMFPLLHPAAALRSRRWARRWNDDLDALGKWLSRRLA
jgi:uracil-DNA glycosylase